MRKVYVQNKNKRNKTKTKSMKTKLLISFIRAYNKKVRI